MENPLLVKSLAYLLCKTKDKIGFVLDKEYLRKVKEIHEIMFIDIEYKGILKRVLLIQEEIGKYEVKKIENKLRRTKFSKDGVSFDYIAIISKEYLSVFRNRVIKGYPANWHTYIVYTQEEPDIGIKIVIDTNYVTKIARQEHIGLRPIKKVEKVYKDEKERIKNERQLDVISDLRKVVLKPKENKKYWFNKYAKGFLRGLFEVEKQSKLVTVNEKIRYYKDSGDATEQTFSEEQISSTEDNKEVNQKEVNMDKSESTEQ